MSTADRTPFLYIPLHVFGKPRLRNPRTYVPAGIQPLKFDTDHMLLFTVVALSYTGYVRIPKHSIFCTCKLNLALPILTQVRADRHGVIDLEHRLITRLRIRDSQNHINAMSTLQHLTLTADLCHFSQTSV